MAYADATRVDRREIPVIDVSDLRRGAPGAARRVAAEMLAAAEDLGFFYVRGHGVDGALLAHAQVCARRFFAAPVERKQEVAIDRHHRGFLRVGEAKMEGNRLPDLKESFVWGLEVEEGDPAREAASPFLGDNRWPAWLPELRGALMPFFEAGNALGRDLLRAFAAAMELDEGAFTARFARPISRGAAVYYPPQPPDLDSEQFGVGPHTDYGCLTVLRQDPVGGLEVRGRSGEWLLAEPIEDTLVINVGDLLARWTNDRFASTPHRVVNRTDRERISLAVFVDPDFDTVIDPRVACAPGEMARYDPITAGAYILERYDAAFSYRQRA